jgi:uncharacterized protein YecE (DUF72 family)
VNWRKSTTAEILLGTSGWSYKEWEGNFYRKGEKRKLRAYTSVFKTAEIDSTFYRNPTKGTVMGWIRYSPPNFVFTAKLPKLITHTKLLGTKGAVKQDLETFLDLIQPLQLSGKLACLLIQLPPKYGYEPKSLETFFNLLDSRFKYAVEFRNTSWITGETWDLLKKYNIAYTNVDEPLLPGEIHLTSDLAYFRWHGRGEKIWFDYRYPPEQLDAWVPKIKEVLPKAKKIVGYFNNHFHGYAPENCLYLLEKLGLSSKSQTKTKSSLERQSHLGDFPEN